MSKHSDINSIKNFLGLKSIAVAGVSRKGNEFSNTAYKMLKERGYRLYQVNPNAEEISGEKCYKDLRSLPEKPDGLLTFLSKDVTKEVLKEANDAEINNIWIQQTSESPEAINYCAENNLNAVYGHCILMHAEPVKGFHKFHRWIHNLFSSDK